MKYLKLFEDTNNDSKFMQFIKKTYDMSGSEYGCLKKATACENFEVFWKIDCGGNNLNDLEGIEKMTNLTDLFCSNNYLTDLLDLINLKKLRVLFCQDNMLLSLMGIENLTNLEILGCSFNKLGGLKEIKNLINLEKIYVNDNKLTSLEFSDYSIDAFEIGVDETDMFRFKKLNTLRFVKNEFSNRYENYIKKYCKEKGIDCR